MVRLSKKVEYGLIAIRHIATKSFGEIVTAKEIADSYKIPYELLAKVLQKLTKSGLIISHQGVHGGYELAMKPGEQWLKAAALLFQRRATGKLQMDDQESHGHGKSFPFRTAVTLIV